MSDTGGELDESSDAVAEAVAEPEPIETTDTPADAEVEQIKPCAEIQAEVITENAPDADESANEDTPAEAVALPAETTEPQVEEKSEEPSAAELGREKHAEYRKSILASAETQGIDEGCDTFTCEKAIRDTNGNVVRDDDGRYGRPDFIDYQNHLIRELKPLHTNDGETEQDVRDTYQDQLERYITLYEKARGVKPTVELDFYPK